MQQENKAVYNSIPISSVAATLAEALGVPAPEGADPPVRWVNRKIGRVSRAVFYHSDAVPMYMFQEHPELFEKVFPHVCVPVPYLAAVSSVTPVCFASMYSGVSPEVHGIKEYVRPRLTVRTFFDTAAAAGKRCVAVVMPDSSFLHIFKGHSLDFIVAENAVEAADKTIEVLEEDKYDYVCVHSFEYDTAAHMYGPRDPRAVEKIALEAECFDRIMTAARLYSRGRRVMTGYGSDHGQHLGEDGLGKHGTTLAEDMNILHFYGVIN